MGEYRLTGWKTNQTSIIRQVAKIIDPKNIHNLEWFREAILWALKLHQSASLMSKICKIVKTKSLKNFGKQRNKGNKINFTRFAVQSLRRWTRIDGNNNEINEPTTFLIS